MITKADDLEDDGPSLSKAEFWQRAAAFSFGAWALALPVAAGAVVSVVLNMSKSFDSYVLTMERRIVLLEERQSRVLQVLQEHSKEIRDLNIEHNADIEKILERTRSTK